MNFRWMLRRDMEEILAIERASFRVPWIEEDFRKMLGARDVVGQVAEGLGEPESPVIGYVVYRLSPDGIELLNLAVHPEHRRRGIGRAIVGKLRDKLHTQRRPRLAVEVEDRNLAGHLFFRACGLRAICVVRGRYGESDAYRFVVGCTQRGGDGLLHGRECGGCTRGP